MKKALFILSVMLMTVVMAKAQPELINVNPGERGELPKVNCPTGSIGETEFLGLYVISIFTDGYIFYGNYHYSGKAWLGVPSLENLEGEYYTLEYRPAEAEDASWSTQLDSEGNPQKTTSGSLYFQPSTIGNYDCRLVLHGGPKNGSTSNVTAVNFPSKLMEIPTSFNGSGSEGWQLFTLVGQEQNTQSWFYVNVSDPDKGNITGTYKCGKDGDDGCCVYQWYRRNPITWQMTKISGANAFTYTPTLADVGYELVLEISGDEIHSSFKCYWYYPDTVRVPVQGSISYFGSDGFLLNTDYVLPTPAETFVYAQDIYSEGEAIDGTIVEKKPGQYAFLLNEEQMENMSYGVLNVKGGGYQFVFCYNHVYENTETGEQTSEYWIREAQPIMIGMRYQAPLTVKAECAGASVPTTIDIIGPNIDGDLVVKRSVTIDGQTDGVTIEEGDGLYSLGDGYYVKARETESTMATYYPSALLWTDAIRVVPGHDEDWNPKAISINVVEAPAPLTGKGVIRGTVSIKDNVAQARLQKVRAKASNATNTYSVYLKQHDGDIVAQTNTDGSGAYKFDNVPYGAYNVLVNVDGYTQERSAEVKLSESKPMANNINYTINADGTITPVSVPTALSTVKAGYGHATYYTLDGRGCQGVPTQPGVYFKDGKKIVMK